MSLEHKTPTPTYLSPEYVIASMYQHSSRLISDFAPAKVFILAIMGGSFVTMGALLSILFAGGIESPGISRLLQGFGYSSGFFFVILTHSVLFTEVNVLLPASILHKPSTRIYYGAVRIWIKAWVGNFLGALLVGWLVYHGQSYSDDIKESLRDLIDMKMMYFEQGGIYSWLKVVLSGILGNWVVGMASFFGMMGKTIIGKYIPILLAVCLFVAANFQHTPANMGFFAISIAIDQEPSWLAALLWNLLPATIGNIIGGSMLVALPFWYTLSKNPR